MDTEFINLTTGNLANEHLCCIIRSKKSHPGVEAKRQWLSERLSEGHVFRKLDAKAKLPAAIFTYSFGIIMSLVLGIGMCLAMGVIGGSTTLSMVAGIIIGTVGIIGVSVNYPIYKKLLASGKKKYAFEIMTLAKEISESDK